MIRWIVRSALRFRFLMIAVAAGIMFVGFGQLRDTPVDVFPEFAPPRVEIQTKCIGLSAAEVESLVTVPLEEALNGVAGLDVMRSKSVPQLSSVELIFKPGVDLIDARQLVSERVGTVAPGLPTWARPPTMIQPLSATSRVMKIGFSSQTMNLIEMSTLAKYKVRHRLLRVPGVANVAIWGERLENINVEVDATRLRAHNVTLNQVMKATADSLETGQLRFSSGAVVGTGGFVESPNQRLGIEHVLPVVSAPELAQVNLGEGTQGLRLGDVADVVVDHQQLEGDAVINDGAGLMLIVEKLPWGNTLEVTRGVEEALNSLRPALPGIEVDTTIFRPATFIETALDNLTLALLLGCLLVILVLVIFLFEWRTALISLIAIPLSLVGAGLVLYLSDASVNTMVLAGLVIAVGVVVDDAIIDIENIMRRLRQHRQEGSTRSTASIVLEASLEVRGPIVYATLIIIAAAVPVFFLDGLTGSFFRPLALSYTLAVGVSMAVALTVTPALALILLRKAPLERRGSPVASALQRGYQGLLGRIVRGPRKIYAGTVAIVLLGVAALPGLGQSLLPEFKERDFLMHWVANPGTSQEEMARITEQASRELRAIPGVRNFGAHIGQALQADEVVGIYFGENWISIDPSADYDATLAAVQKVVDGYPGLRRDVQTYLKERIREVLSGASEAVVVRVYGQDLNTMRDKANEVKQILSGIDGVIEEHVDLQVEIPQLEVEVDLAKAQQHGIKPGDVRRAAGTMVASEEVNEVYRDGKAYGVFVWSTPETRDSPSAIRELPIGTPTGTQVRLGDVADVRIRPTPNVIEHDGGSRSIDVGANVSGRDLGSVVGELEKKLAGVQFPQGHHAELLGEYAERQDAQTRILIFTMVAVLAIFLLLQVSFGSWRLATLSFFTLPSALVGGILAAYLSGGILSLGSLVGFLTVLGIAARNGILLISHYRHLEREEGVAFGPDLVLRGSRERLTPILMTTLATALALVPLVVMGSIPGHEIEHPMAVVILGGLVTSTLLNLFIVPSLYLRFGRARRAAAADG
nr:efflux RND transporter permease subunit [Kibdelosporangium sp. MJ126-NF4]CEL21707.1 Cobalt-zinc-cadmium resistance protein CzcA; Cation efflux system protein CusA [Kibdelosporangium sp. MJ126-NF4]CTQ92488.1 Cobalt-zinc-cadmium resistance protein CzcA; Cation efflux system protein CusA [Kibdelosporangium sp. MJ126-NF4]